MRGCSPRTVQGRAIIGVIALYGLLLQAFLGTLLPLRAAPFGSEICAEHAGAGAPGDREPACQHHECCTAAQAAALPDPLLSAFALVAWAPARAAPAGWDAAGSVRARAPPDRSASPRGPPAS